VNNITVELIRSQLMIGLSLGIIYVLMASGLSIIFGLLRVVNFAHGTFYMLGAYSFFYMLTLTGHFWIALILSPIVIAVIGMLTEIFTIRPLYGTNEINPLLLTLGLTYVFVDVIRIAFGLAGEPTAIPAGFTGVINFGFMTFPKYRFFIIIVGAIVIGLVWLFINKTNIGMIIRASTKDSEMVQMLGLNVRRVWTMVFGIGIGLAALAGALSAPISGINPEMGTITVIEAFVVVVVGGMGSLAGSVVAGLLVGEIVALTTLYYGQAGHASIFALMVIILLTTKYGLFGEE
jgi:branched-chain amino acid transport system permease protein